METNNCSNSKKRKFTQISGGKNDGSIEAQLEAMKAEIAKLKEESNLKDALIVKQALKINQFESSAPNEDDMEAEMERLKEVNTKLRAELVETEKKMEEEQQRHESEIAALKSAVVARESQQPSSHIPNLNVTHHEKLKAFTTKWIKDNVIVEPNTLALRGEMYAACVEHLRSVNGIMSGTVNLFTQLLQSVFPCASLYQEKNGYKLCYYIKGVRYLNQTSN